MREEKEEVEKFKKEGGIGRRMGRREKFLSEGRGDRKEKEKMKKKNNNIRRGK